MTVSRLAEYEASLPDGLDSYPDCRHKAEFFCDFLKHFPVATHARSLPKPLRYLVEKPLRPSAWLPEVHTNAFYLATRDHLFERDDELCEALYQVNRRVLSTPLNWVMFMVASHTILLSAPGARWAAFHRGSEMKTSRHGQRGGSFELIYPSHLFPRLMIDVYEKVFQAVFDLARVAKARVRVVACEATTAKFEVRWRQTVVEHA